jgi:hypothetical protein
MTGRVSSLPAKPAKHYTCLYRIQQITGPWGAHRPGRREERCFVLYFVNADMHKERKRGMGVGMMRCRSKVWACRCGKGGMIACMRDSGTEWVKRSRGEGVKWHAVRNAASKQVEQKERKAG